MSLIVFICLCYEQKHNSGVAINFSDVHVWTIHNTVAQCKHVDMEVLHVCLVFFLSSVSVVHLCFISIIRMDSVDFLFLI